MPVQREACVIVLSLIIHASDVVVFTVRLRANPVLALDQVVLPN